MVRAVIDLGTNSLKCVVAKLENGAVTILEELQATTRLGGELASAGRMGEDAIQRSILALSRFKKICDERGVGKAVCVGAETLRRAADAGKLEVLLQSELGWRLHILSAREEATLIYRASAILAGSAEEIMVIDSGGGSTEFSLGTGSEIAETHSLPLGAVTLTQEFVSSDPITLEELSTLQEHIRMVLEKAFPQPRTKLTIASGGGLNSLAAVALRLEPYSAEQVHGFRLTLPEILRQTTLYGELDLSERKYVQGLPPERADIILAGAVLVAEIMGCFGLSEVTVSTQGLRHALLTDEEFWGELKPLPVCTRHHRQLL